MEAQIDLCPDLRGKLDAALVEDCPLPSREGGFIRDGFSDELDALRDLAHGGKQWIAQYQAHQSERTGIPNLKVGFNKVFGYYLEVTNTHQGKVPDDYIRKQTVKNAERYITPELKEYEERVLAADEKSKELEYDLFLGLREAVAASRRQVQQTAAVLAQIDVMAALADLAHNGITAGRTWSNSPCSRFSMGGTRSWTWPSLTVRSFRTTWRREARRV